MADITCKDNKNLELKGLILIYLTVIYIYMHC